MIAISEAEVALGASGSSEMAIMGGLTPRTPVPPDSFTQSFLTFPWPKFPAVLAALLYSHPWVRQ